MPPQGQPVEAVEQHRQPLGAAEHVEERIQTRLVGVLAEEALAHRVPAADPELFEGPLQQRLAAFAQARRRGLAGGDHQQRLGPGPLLHQVGEAAGEQLGLAGAGSADDQQRPGIVGERMLPRSGGALQRGVVLGHRPTLAAP
jgi:hypothetical protein